jgi:hypothetical protein
MSGIQERADFLASQLHRILWQVSDDSRHRGNVADPSALITLIGVALLLRTMDEATGATGQSNSRLWKIQDKGRSSMVRAILDSLTESREWGNDIWNELHYLLEVEVRDFEDERIRFILKRVEKLEVPGGSLGERHLLGRAFHGLIELAGTQPFAINSSVTRLMAALAESPSDGLPMSDPFMGTGFLAFEVAFQAAKSGATPPVIEGRTSNKGYWFLANLLGRVYGFDCRIEVGDSIRNPHEDNQGLKTYDLVVSEPPMGAKIHVGDMYDKHNRFAEVTQAFEWMALQHIVASMGEHGKAVVLTAPSVLFSKGAGAKIRTKWIQEDIIESIITLPVGMWQPVTNLAPVILVLNKEKSYFTRKTIFFLQIEGDEFIKPVPKSRGKKIISDEGISKILDQFKLAKENIDPEFSFTQAFANRVFDRSIDGLEKDGCDLRPKQFLEEEEAAQKQFKPFLFSTVVKTAMKRQREAESHLDQLLEQHFQIDLKETPPRTEEQHNQWVKRMREKWPDEFDEE